MAQEIVRQDRVGAPVGSSGYGDGAGFDFCLLIRNVYVIRPLSPEGAPFARTRTKVTGRFRSLGIIADLFSHFSERRTPPLLEPPVP